MHNLQQKTWLASVIEINKSRFRPLPVPNLSDALKGTARQILQIAKTMPYLRSKTIWILIILISRTFFLKKYQEQFYTLQNHLTAGGIYVDALSWSCLFMTTFSALNSFCAWCFSRKACFCRIFIISFVLFSSPSSCIFTIASASMFIGLK